MESSGGNFLHWKLTHKIPSELLIQMDMTIGWGTTNLTKSKLLDRGINQSL